MQDSDANTANNMEDEEERVLASVDASLQELNSYESNVIRKATHQLAPELTGVGFPSLQALGPSYSDATADSYNPLGDVPAVLTVLAQTRRKLQRGEESSSASSSQQEQQDLMHLKEQILLSFLSNAEADLPIRPEEERAAEDKRSRALQQQQQQQLIGDATDKLGSADASGQSTPVGVGRKRARISIMKRKRMSVDPHQLEPQDEKETEKRKEELKKLRIDRKRRKEQRRQQILGEPSSSENETEFDVASDSESNKEELVDAREEKSADNDSTAELASVVCPLCQTKVETPDPDLVDAVLSQHMDQCQRQRPRRRAARGDLPSASALDRDSTPKHARRSLAKPKKKGKKRASVPRLSSVPSVDDLQEWVYEDRVDNWIEDGLSKMKKMKERDSDDVLPGAEEFPGGLLVPAWVNDRLFGYQRTGLRWMWDLHQQEAGGIVGDEMGLGKTVQVSAFLGVLASSRKLRSVLVVAPATMLQHWLNELAVWSPGLRRILIHSSGEADGLSRSISVDLLRALEKWLKHARRDRVNEAIDEEDWDKLEPHVFCGTGYAVVTTYESLRRNPDIYTSNEWSYVVLDEVQKIRNPDADVTIAAKKIRTPHRLGLSGTPIQNCLRELWSLFDFVFPGRLGTLPAFEQEFADPIKRGGYSNASPMQVQLAYRSALMLRGLISPYLLRRQKIDVKEVNRMPGKTEHVLFCRLSQRQRALYEAYLLSDDVTRVMRGSGQLLAAVTMLRKICNHPNLVCDADQASFESFVRNGYVNQADIDDDSEFDDDIGTDETLTERSGKLEVLSKILPLWHKQGHRVLIFCQWQKMLNIIQRFTMMKGWKFGRLDGKTNVASRQRLVDSFNTDDSYFGMLCTTRTGGVGLNLTGANRIILYDPDWNPQTDAQARERAWRFGQEREVTVYRLITAGTVEEKIYHRQIFKTALSNKVLQDPRQRRLFSQRDLKDLFSLKPDTVSMRSGGDGLTETSVVTKGLGLVDPSGEQTEESSSKDNEETLKKVMKSKGLAGVFDHDFVEEDSSRKTTSVREMEEQAKKVARNAAKILRESVSTNDPFTPTWTGSEATGSSRFGSSRGPGAGVLGSGALAIGASVNSSAGLLTKLRQRNAAVESDGTKKPPSEEMKSYAKLLAKAKDFVRKRTPTTEDILNEFKSVPDCDIAIFRRLLKSVAVVEKGKWYLKEGHQ